ncbi:MAG: hypothetical protein AAGA56_12690 [Myxococcota bacterium]
MARKRHGWRHLRLRRIEDPARATAMLRDRSLENRALLERELSAHFFAPFRHQETVEGRAFRQRAAWCRSALSAPLGEEEKARLDHHFETWKQSLEPRGGDLLFAFHRLVVPILLELSLGPALAESVAGEAFHWVRELDDVIKLRRGRDLAHRLRFAAVLSDALRRGPVGGLVGYAQAEHALAHAELVDQVGGVLLGTGPLQWADVLTHALIALDQHEAAKSAPDRLVLWETLRCFPVNASVTRRDARHRSWSFVPLPLTRAGWRDPAAFAPERWRAQATGFSLGFGVGPRSCPAARLSRQGLAHLLGRIRRETQPRIEAGYRHRRSLAEPPQARFDGVVPPPARGRVRRRLGYGVTAALTYPIVGTRVLLGSP